MLFESSIGADFRFFCGFVEAFKFPVPDIVCMVAKPFRVLEPKGDESDSRRRLRRQLA
jgi:hypothetical protein